MKKVFRYKKGDSFDNDDNMMNTLFDIICEDNGEIKEDIKITIIAEKERKNEPTN